MAGRWAMLPGTSCMFGSQEETDVSRDPARPPHAHETAPDGMGSFSTLMLMQLLSLGPGSGLANKNLISPADDSSLPIVHQIPIIRQQNHRN
eukprot:1147900-Pelagomonas_calceolata.AAC.3